MIILSCLIVLVLEGAVLVSIQILAFRKSMVADVGPLADRINADFAAAVVANDRQAAVEALNELSNRQHLLGAILMLPDGTRFASYGTRLDDPTIGASQGVTIEQDQVRLIAPVMLAGEQVATLDLLSDYSEVRAQLASILRWTLLVMITVCTVVSLLLATWLQRFISYPILRLARTAREVIERNDYSLRAREESGVEMNVLTRSFNQMLAHIQKQDLALTLSQQRIEAIVNSIDGIVWQRTPDTLEFTYVSRQCQSIMGYDPEQVMNDPNFWRDRIHPDDADKVIRAWLTCITSGQPYACEYRAMASGERQVWISERGSVMMEMGQPLVVRGIMQDVTAQKVAAQELEALNQNLVQASRLAGRAEVATGVLHNVGNVLNSVSVCTGILTDHLRESRVEKLLRAAEMMRDRNGQLAEFLTADPKGKLLPDYLYKSAKQLAVEQSEMLNEVELMAENVEHIKQIVALQQTHAKVVGAFEHIAPTDLVEDALRMNAATYEKFTIEVVRDYQTPLPRVNVDRHKVLQILVNLLQNAKDALNNETAVNRQVVLRVENPGEGRVVIRVIDNGSGIAPEHLPCIFQHGFTTRREGHGFGLHSSANAAKEVGGLLTARSEGRGMGAEFMLELPAVTEDHCPNESPALAVSS